VKTSSKEGGWKVVNGNLTTPPSLNRFMAEMVGVVVFFTDFIDSF